MGLRFEELDWQETPIGPVSLRRRMEPTLDVEVYEVKLGDEFLMSSLFTVAEVALARIGLGETRGDRLDVLVGGLGLGYTARAALEDDRVGALSVVEALQPVIDWHRNGLLPDASGLAADPRTVLVQADFFAWVRGDVGLGAQVPDEYDAVLLDIDHSPRHALHATHADFYTGAGLEALARHLRPEGVFALWSDDPPDEVFLGVLRGVFPSARAEVVDFDNPLTRGVSSNTVYVARRG